MKTEWEDEYHSLLVHIYNKAYSMATEYGNAITTKEEGKQLLEHYGKHIMKEIDTVFRMRREQLEGKN